MLSSLKNEGIEVNLIEFLMRKLPYSIFIKDTNSVYVIGNEQFAKELGISSRNIAGKTDFDFHERSDAERYRTIDKRIMELNASEEIEEKITLQGEDKYFRILKTPLTDESKNVVGILGIRWEITEQKFQKFRLEKLNRLYRFISGINQTIIKAQDNKELFDEVCRISIEIGGFSFAWIGFLDDKTNRMKPLAHYGNENGYLKFILSQTPDNNNRLRQIALDLRKEKYFVSNDIQQDFHNSPEALEALNRGFNSVAAFAIIINGVMTGQYNLYSTEIGFFDEEEIKLLLEITSDISFNILATVNKNKKNAAEDKIRKSETKFRTVWEHSFDAMRLSDKEGRIVAVNDAFCRLVKKNKDELEGQLINSIYWKKEDLSFEAYPKDFNSRNISSNLEMEITLWNRKRIQVELSNSFIELEKETYLFSIFRDITERKKAEEEILVAKDKAEESSRLKTSLLGNMSHELRTPLTGILGFTQILIDEIEDPYLNKMVQKIKLSGQRLMSTLNSVLSLSELETGMSELSVSETKVNTYISYITRPYVQIAQEKHLNFVVEYWKDDLSVLVDEKLFNQILSNLIDNAIKYTEKGGVLIGIKPETRDEQAFVNISIMDTGIGINENLHEFVFDEFRQASEGVNRNFEGNGLGLTLARKMARLMGGDIEMQSQSAKGSIFTIRLPQYLEENAMDNMQSANIFSEDVHLHPKTVQTIKRKPHVLIVEDNAINVEVLEMFLSGLCITTHSKNGEQAIKCASEQRFDAIIMDINLGIGLNGIETTKHLRKINGYENTPVVAITGYAMSSDRDQILSEGLDYYLAKPIDKCELVELMGTILQ